MAGDDYADFRTRNCPTCRLDPGDLTITLINRSHFTVLDDIDTTHIGATRKTPGHRIVSCDTAAGLK